MFNFNDFKTNEALKLLTDVAGYDDEKFIVIRLLDITYDRYEQTTEYEQKVVYEDTNEGSFFTTSLLTTVDKTGKVIEIEYSACPDQILGYDNEADAITVCLNVNFEM